MGCLRSHYFSAIFWKLVRIIIPASHQGLESSNLGAGIIWAQTGGKAICFSCCLTQKLLNRVHNHTWAAPQGALCFTVSTSPEEGGGEGLGR